METKQELRNKIEELEKGLKSAKANIIRAIKKNHPKGFCYICGKGKKTTAHHLRETTLRRKGKIVGIIPLCRDCHDDIERMKLFTKFKLAFKQGKKVSIEAEIRFLEKLRILREDDGQTTFPEEERIKYLNEKISSLKENA